VSLPDQQKVFEATVSNVPPQVDPASRVLKVRLEVDNPGYTLKPDMFVDVEFPINLPPAITVPADAVLDSGLKKTVFVDRGNGFFEPRRVETGRSDKVGLSRAQARGGSSSRQLPHDPKAA
jgi:multidrug efflux pump subunit AcrA (membrane-fusion protein)